MSLRTLVAATSAALLLAGLAACGGDDKEEAADAPAPAANSDTTDSGDSGDSGDAPAAEGGDSITMKEYKFDPAEITVKAGATIEIINKDSVEHNLVDDKNGINSGDIKGGATGSVKAPEKAGTYPYVCTYHAGMTGTLVVS